MKLYSLIAALVLVLITQSTTTLEAKELSDIFNRHNPSSNKTINHTEFGKLLSSYVKRDKTGVNLVNYKSLKKDQNTLKAYIASLSKLPISDYNKNEQFAFWANLYNAVTLDVVLNAYPVKTIRDIDISPGLFSNGPWGKKLVTVENKQLSLNDIEHKIMRPIYKDPRVHYAVNCASFSCPNLRRQPFDGADLDKQLNDAAKDYINNPRGAKIKNGALHLSKIYSWYKKDFGTSNSALIAHIKRYAEQPLRDQLKSSISIAGYNYDWKLNDTSK